MRLVRLLAVVLVAMAPLGALAVDAPHYGGFNCTECHFGHNAPGASLTKEEFNFALCESCHYNKRFGVWVPSDQAVPGSSGRSHSWNAPANGMGATPPGPGTPMGIRLDSAGGPPGNLQCSTCHDQHQADALIGSPPDVGNLGTPHVTAISFSSTAVPAGTGTMTFAANSPVSGATAKFYGIEIVGPGSGTNATFRLTNDPPHDTTPNWRGCTTETTYDYVAYVTSPSPNPCRVGSSIQLNDGTNVTVAFAGGANTFKTGDRWDFWISYPFLRVANKDGAMCTTCHVDRDMRWQDVEGGVPNGVEGGVKNVDLGNTVFSHPVAQALSTSRNGLAAILDVDGAVQPSTADAKATNNLVTGTGGIVTCLTCHHPHNADSNSLTEDTR